ncbi:MAG: AzlC family ABC transporter permease, partial [Lentisphaeria bacterium]|nr:AzlC family ABC transporter permease [Lentisphaeria bacterium]MBR4076577.1 AzlC family ABC transporter permease [Lentisphaeria bacterium]
MITKRVFNAAFKASLPVLMGYLAMGMASGILLAKTVSIPCLPLWAFLTSAVNISGAFQFLLVDWVKNTTVLFQVVLLTICLNLRYAMYGFSLLERFKKVPLLQKLYLIWALTDETYAIQVANKVPEG